MFNRHQFFSTNKLEIAAVVLKIQLKSKMVDFLPWQQKTFKH